MTGKRGFFSPWLLGGVFLGAVLLSAPVFAQTAPAQNNWGFDYEGKAIVAVLPLAGDETEMIRRFHEGMMEAVAALEKYSPQTAYVPESIRIPTDLPPLASLAGGARYALTGGVYPGSEAGEYYLQLWLWDMAGSMMIYTDDLVYDDIDEAMGTLPGLVEWLFSHIHERVIEEPPADTWPDPFFMFGLRAGVSPRWYIKPSERSPGASALNFEGGVSGALRLNSLFSLQLEFLFTTDTLVYRGLNLVSNPPVVENEKYTNFTLEIPIILKMNFRVGELRLSPLAGLYAAVPLGQTGFRDRYGKEHSYSWSSSLPLGFTAGLEGAARYGPGMVFAGLRYGGDFGVASVNAPQERSYRRQMVSLYLGYEFGFF
jgi:hypothetical protein